MDPSTTLHVFVLEKLLIATINQEIKVGFLRKIFEFVQINCPAKFHWKDPHSSSQRHNHKATKERDLLTDSYIVGLPSRLVSTWSQV